MCRMLQAMQLGREPYLEEFSPSTGWYRPELMKKPSKGGIIIIDRELSFTQEHLRVPYSYSYSYLVSKYFVDPFACGAHTLARGAGGAIYKLAACSP